MEIKPIRGVIALLTNQCNLSCPYCFEDRDVHMMSLDTAKDIVDFVGKNTSSHVTLFGGEPTLMWDSIIEPLFDYAFNRENKVKLNMTTNGTLLTRKRIDFLVNNGITFMLSMDGNKATQDASRPAKNGSSSFDSIDLDYLLYRKPRLPVRATLTPANACFFFENYLFFERAGIKDFGVLPDYFVKWSEKEKGILAEQIQMFEEYVLNSYRSGTTPLLFRSYCVAFSNIFRLQNISDRRKSPDCVPENQCGMGVRGGCSADVFGNLYACHHISPLTPKSEWCIGNIYDGVDEERVKNIINKYDASSVGNDGCNSCPLDKVCNGGCKSNNYMICGDVNKVPEIYCYWNRLITDSAYRVAIELGNEDNKAFIKTFNRWKGLRE